MGNSGICAKRKAHRRPEAPESERDEFEHINLVSDKSSQTSEPSFVANCGPQVFSFPFPILVNTRGDILLSDSLGSDYRVYAVWKVPGDPLSRGIWIGPADICWPQLSRRLPNSCYSFKSGCRLRRYDSILLALRGYEAEAKQHSAPLPAPFHFVFQK